MRLLVTQTALKNGYRKLPSQLVVCLVIAMSLLPSQLVVCLVIAMSLWSSDSMETVLRNLVNGLSRQWTKLGQYWKVPSSSSISEARQRVGCLVVSQLFERIVEPLGTCETPGAILGGLLMKRSRRDSAGCTG